MTNISALDGVENLVYEDVLTFRIFSIFDIT